MAARGRQCCGGAKRVAVDSVSIRQGRDARSQGAGLVEHSHVGLGEPFESICRLEQNSLIEKPRGRRHLHGRNSQGQRARVGDDQNRNRDGKRGFPARARDHPSDKGGRGERVDHWCVKTRRPIREAHIPPSRLLQPGPKLSAAMPPRGLLGKLLNGIAAIKENSPVAVGNTNSGCRISQAPAGCSATSIFEPGLAGRHPIRLVTRAGSATLTLPPTMSFCNSQSMQTRDRSASAAQSPANTILAAGKEAQHRLSRGSVSAFGGARLHLATFVGAPQPMPRWFRR
jgi:hypothetical protein